jgi:hypothetical protein
MGSQNASGSPHFSPLPEWLRFAWVPNFGRRWKKTLEWRSNAEGPKQDQKLAYHFAPSSFLNSGENATLCC